MTGRIDLLGKTLEKLQGVSRNTSEFLGRLGRSGGAAEADLKKLAETAEKTLGPLSGIKTTGIGAAESLVNSFGQVGRAKKASSR